MTDAFNLSDVIEEFEKQNQKGVTKIIKSVEEKIFHNDLNDGNIEECKDFVSNFTSLYYLMKKKFNKKYRKSGEGILSI